VPEPVTSRELVRIVAADFDRRGWRDEDELALAIATQADRGQELDPAAAAGLAPESFLAANGTDANALEAALRALFSGRTFAEADRSGPTFVDQSITIGDNNTISGNVNAGGNQIGLTNNTPPAELLSALTAFTTTATSDGFSPAELELLDRLLALRDVDPQQVEAAVREGIGEPEPGHLARFRDAVAASTTSGVAVQAILAVAGALL
jgi:hypothetical protein